MIIITGLVPAPWHDAAVAPKLRQLSSYWFLPSPHQRIHYWLRGSSIPVHFDDWRG